ncbi:MAG TPA: hypothetical protein VEH04_16230, partial [Verrucomicrobiae bacterium]|nr:hypothetical protein [Verrucomicrobiae bacterium]
KSAISMFSYDLVSGHRLLFAPYGCFNQCEHHLIARDIPLHEATRLLMNRCTGLLLVQELLKREKLSDSDSDFVGRNLAKAQLALGDVVLTASGEYHWSCEERHQRLKALAPLEKLPWWRDVEKHHAMGKEFKLHPARMQRSVRQFTMDYLSVSDLARQVWLWLENQRLGQKFGSVREYGLSRVPKCAEHSAIHSLLVNVRTFGTRALVSRAGFRYPRERLLNSLPLLLWENPGNDVRVRRSLQKQLRTSGSDWQSFVAVYKNLWPPFS